MHEPHDAPALRQASTVILTRPLDEEAPRGAFEVFMVKRSARSRFMASVHVYPGGRLDEADCDATLHARVMGLGDEEAASVRLQEPSLREATAVGLHLAAVREAFEESGVLLARVRGGGDAAGVDEVARWRERLVAQRGTLLEMAEALDLVFDLGGLRPLARWVTPPIERRRYDTRFFVAACPPAQRDALEHDARETVASAWLRPRAVLEGYRSGALDLAPPTLMTLEQLMMLGTLEAVEAHCDEVRIAPVLPALDPSGGERVRLLLPGDEAYPDAARRGDAHRVTHATRVVLDDAGRWRTREAE